MESHLQSHTNNSVFGTATLYKDGTALIRAWKKTKTKTKRKQEEKQQQQQKNKQTKNHPSGLPRRGDFAAGQATFLAY